MNNSIAKKENTFLVTFQRLCRSKLAVVSMIVLAVMIILAIFAPVIAPYDYTKIDPLATFLTPGSEGHILGTDDLGRDMFSRLLMGARLSMLIGIAGVVVATVGGIVLGSVAGFFGGKVDNILMRLMDILQAIPGILLAIVVCAALGQGVINCVVAIAISMVPGNARLCRATFLNIRNLEYVEAATSINASKWRIIVKHILPNCLAPLLVNATMNIGACILTAASLSFIGVGVQPPAAEWGAMLSGARQYARNYPYMVILPGVCIMILVLAINLIGDGLRDALDPKLRD